MYAEPFSGSIPTIDPTATGAGASTDSVGFGGLTGFFDRATGGAGNVVIELEVSNDANGTDWYQTGVTVTLAADESKTLNFDGTFKRFRFNVTTAQASSVVTGEYLAGANFQTSLDA